MCTPYNPLTSWSSRNDPPPAKKALDPDFTEDDQIYEDEIDGAIDKFLKIMIGVNFFQIIHMTFILTLNFCYFELKGIPRCSDMIEGCTWNAEPVNCTVFSDRVTDSGGTCAFNQIPSKLSRRCKIALSMGNLKLLK